MARCIWQVWVGIALALSVLKACDMPWTVPPPRTGGIVGRLEPWNGQELVTHRYVALCRQIQDARPGECDLMQRATVTDATASFSFENVPVGTYFLMLESGVGDFEAMLNEWGGKRLHLGDPVWLSDFLNVNLEEEWQTLLIPEGVPWSPHRHWLREYCRLTLMIDQSPIIIAHDLDLAAESRQLHCLLVTVKPDLTRSVTVKAPWFGPRPMMSARS